MVLNMDTLVKTCVFLLFENHEVDDSFFFCLHGQVMFIQRLQKKSHRALGGGSVQVNLQGFKAFRIIRAP